MKIRHIISKVSLSAILVATMLGSCENFTEVDQKGMNLLSKTTELDLLLNAQYGLDWQDMGYVCGDVLSSTKFLPTALAEPNKSYTEILQSWSEEDHATKLLGQSTSDGFYADCYRYIGRIANPILMQVDAAKGSEEEKKLLKSEALAIRGYFHFLAAQKYAKPYDKSMAATELCVPYISETQGVMDPVVQQTQQTVYENILKDLDKSIDINGLPAVSQKPGRLCSAFPHAAKAHVLLAMGEYAKAAQAAEKALEIRGTVNDYKECLETGPSFMGQIATLLVMGPAYEMEEDYFTDNSQNMLDILITPFNESMYEDGHYKKDYYPTYANMMKGMYNPMDPEADLQGFRMNAEMQYGVPYLSVFDMMGQNNTVGIKSSHMLLILAECAIAEGNIGKAMRYLDRLRVKRINPAIYQPLEGNVTEKVEAIKYLKLSAHGEYVYSMWNFFSRKRWSKIDDYKETFSRELCGQTYTLTPESDLWIFPFPIDLVSINPNIKQNCNCR